MNESKKKLICANPKFTSPHIGPENVSPLLRGPYVLDASATYMLHAVTLQLLRHNYVYVQRTPHLLLKNNSLYKFHENFANRRRGNFS